eukprot:scaffold279817_cov32-Tisochrysis_lutea.AAC.1
MRRAVSAPKKPSATPERICAILARAPSHWPSPHRRCTYWAHRCCCASESPRLANPAPNGSGATMSMLAATDCRRGDGIWLSQPEPGVTECRVLCVKIVHVVHTTQSLHLPSASSRVVRPSNACIGIGIGRSTSTRHLHLLHLRS